MASTLYICYFGLREPLVQTQVLPYLREIRNDCIEVSILTFEPDLKSKWTPEQIAAERAALASEGIDWHCLEYHKWPSVPATVYDIFRGTFFIRNFIAKNKPDILHGRVHLPTLMGALARKLSRHKPKLLFDIRGFFPEEYTDADIWPEGGWLYRSAKRVERWLMKESDGFVVLTEKARQILFPNAIPQPDGGWLTPSAGDETPANPKSQIQNPKSFSRPIEVIPCCVDLKRFEQATAETRVEVRQQFGISDRFVMAYVGAFGGWYLTAETADLFGELKKQRPDSFAMILTQSDPAVIEPLLRERGYNDGDFLITRVASAEIPRYLSGADAAVSFIKRCYSKQASSPTKNAEYLACGLPIIANVGVGDVDELINNNRVGALVADFTTAEYRAAFESLDELGEVGERCREVARREFDLAKVGGTRYRRIYDRLLKGE